MSAPAFANDQAPAPVIGNIEAEAALLGGLMLIAWERL